ncbi:hypothetical protein AVEN_37732-1 [Araneus ventricosus]|uniref:Uncharacterized protein n=1 Tax=Araneus ventricosus TaxID=182803 RepID=A0A4Y2BT91_ARAVE|nr:hypothetical protein AVEN_37732-1 [Araneus ventricosus]
MVLANRGCHTCPYNESLTHGLGPIHGGSSVESGCPEPSRPVAEILPPRPPVIHGNILQNGALNLQHCGLIADILPPGHSDTTTPAKHRGRCYRKSADDRAASVELSSEEASPGDGKISEGVPRGGPSAS